MRTWLACAAFFAVSLLVPMPGHAADGWLIASHNETINTGQAILIEAVRPAHLAAWPASLRLKISGAGVEEEVELSPEEAASTGGERRLYSGNTRKKFAGIVRAELVDQKSNRLMMLASQDDDTGPVQIADPTATGEPQSSGSAAPTVVIAQPGDEPALSANERAYFLLGSDDERGTDARFQLSFKYRPFAPESSVAEFLPYLSNLYFAYTQTTVWDIGDESSPFRDTSYRPSLFYRWVGDGGSIAPQEWRAGYEHESNGQSGTDSRSIDTAFVRPTWHIDFANGKRLTLLPKFYQYLAQDNTNSDIERYRGYADWQLRYGREDGLVVGGLFRHGTGGYASGQLDFSYPLSDRIFARTGTFMHLQIFSGYGETLLDYNIDRGTQIRLGLSLVR